MSDGRPRKRDSLRGFLGFRRPESPKTGLHTPAAGSSARSVASLSETTTPPTAAPASSTQYLVTLTEPPRGAIGGATSKSNPTSQPGPIAITAATHTQVGNEGEPPPPTAAGSTNSDARSLWNTAIKSKGLSLQERKTLDGIGSGVDSWETLSAVRSTVEKILNKKKGERWKVEFRDEEIVLRDVAMKIARRVDRFKQIGDIIVQYDPGHAALPWAGFRFILQVGLNR